MVLIYLMVSTIFFTHQNGNTKIFFYKLKKCGGKCVVITQNFAFGDI